MTQLQSSAFSIDPGQSIKGHVVVIEMTGCGKSTNAAAEYNDLDRFHSTSPIRLRRDVLIFTWATPARSVAVHYLG